MVCAEIFLLNYAHEKITYMASDNSDVDHFRRPSIFSDNVS